MILAIVLAVVSVSLMVAASLHFFPAQEPSPLPKTPPLLDVTLSQYNDSTQSFKFNITQGETIRINVTLISLSNQTEFTTPLYLSVGAFENQPSYTKIIASPPSPYPVLPWPSHDDSPDVAKPFEAAFDPNPIILEPSETKTAILTITALEDAKLGTYTMSVEMGNWEQTGLGGATFWLTIMP
jgi:hypothetical protein